MVQHIFKVYLASSISFFPVFFVFKWIFFQKISTALFLLLNGGYFFSFSTATLVQVRTALEQQHHDHVTIPPISAYSDANLLKVPNPLITISSSLPVQSPMLFGTSVGRSTRAPPPFSNSTIPNMFDTNISTALNYKFVSGGVPVSTAQESLLTAVEMMPILRLQTAVNVVL